MSLMEVKDYLTVVAIMISAIAIFCQMVNTNKQIKNQNKQKVLDYEYKRKEKAVEMALVFEKMLKEITYIVVVSRKTKLKEFYHDKIKFNQLEKFDYNELMQEIGIDNIEEVKKISNLEENNIDELKQLYELFYSSGDHLIEKNADVDTEELKKKLVRDFKHRRDYVLNRLEWFSMTFMSGLADEGVVYQSLHQAFLSSVKLLHFEICYRNGNGSKDKYYCNIIE